MLSEERTMKSEKVYEGKILSIRVDTIELPGQRYSKREIVEHVGCVGVIAVTKENKVVLVKQYRKAVENFLLELPAGKIDNNEDPITAAKRELQEETGYVTKNFEFLTEFYTTPGFCTEKISIFIAKDLEPGEQNLDECEDIEVLECSLDEALKMVKHGEIVDAKTILGLTMYKLFCEEV